MDRNEAIKTIKTALQKRSGKAWSVTGGRGTSWGWISISAPPKRLVDGVMTRTDCHELAKLLGKAEVHCQGESIPSSNDYYSEYVARAEGRTPEKIATPYWD